MIEEIIKDIESDLTIVFQQVAIWFDAGEQLKNYGPANGGWSIKKILEHISLTNNYLLILIKKGTAKAVAKATNENYIDLLTNYSIDTQRLNKIGEHQSFYWNRPQHMEPSGKVELLVVKATLEAQLIECINCLEQLKNGEGILYKTTMTVNELGKIDVYHYIYILAQHAKRHLTQMEKVKVEFEKF